MIPNTGILARAITEVNPRQVIFHSLNNVRTDLFQPSNTYDGRKMIVPNSIYIEPTMICNRRCDGCYPEKLGGKIA